ncbi:MAG TPA: diaminopimelate epimerase [Terracidiphilus sp.]|nr:diaminopimelate epimerase [Terracidiphilus sp.]
MIPFTKAHACGNDFLIVTEEAAAGRDWASLTRHLCARNTGIGADGIEFFAWTNKPTNIHEKHSNPPSGRIRLHNADGSVAEISGNGTRCVAAWMAASLGAQPGDELHIETDAGLRICRINAVHTSPGYSVEVTSGMGIPTFASTSVKLASGCVLSGTTVSTGNPHFVIVVDKPDFSVASQSWQVVGAEICAHPDFPHQTNVEFVRVRNQSQIEIRIFERGVGPTTSSGTGSSASATAAIALSLVTSPLTVVAPGGAQTVTWNRTGTELFLTGPATLIARGEAWES